MVKAGQSFELVRDSFVWEQRRRVHVRHVTGRGLLLNLEFSGTQGSLKPENAEGAGEKDQSDSGDRGDAAKEREDQVRRVMERKENTCT